MRPKQLAKGTFFVVLASVGYWHMADAAVALGSIGQMPEWWSGERPSTIRIYAWYQSMHGLALALVSAPFALAIRWVRMPCPILTALAISMIGLALPMAVLQAGLLLDTPLHLRLWAGLGFLKFIGVLPLVTWLAGHAALSNNSFKPDPLRGSA